MAETARKHSHILQKYNGRRATKFTVGSNRGKDKSPVADEFGLDLGYLNRYGDADRQVPSLQLSELLEWLDSSQNRGHHRLK